MFFSQNTHCQNLHHVLQNGKKDPIESSEYVLIPQGPGTASDRTVTIEQLPYGTALALSATTRVG